VVEITRQPIELFKILKFEGLANSGGQAKLVIADGQVLLNGTVETQKSKKIVSGDVITFMDDTLHILLKEAVEPKTDPTATAIPQPADNAED
jgi:ribosome-associated protein